MSLLEKIFPPGKMAINLDNSEFHPGDEVKGTLILTTKHPVKARSLEVRVYGYREVRRKDPMDPTKTETVRETIFDFPRTLDTEKDYSSKEYPFAIPLPSSLYGGKMPKLDGALGAAAEAASLAMNALKTSGVRWYVEGKLDIPGGRDIASRTRIIVR